MRLMSVNSMIERIGGYDYWEDFAQEMLDLLRLIAGHMNNPAMAHAVLLEQWNDSDVTNSIIYYLRLLAATYLKNNGGTYDAFVESAGGIQAYCSTAIEPVNKEIEHLGIVALFNILLQPPGMVLEVAYLDRSPGSQVNTYRFPEEATGQDLASFGSPIYLLYRPDHYDILYRAPPRLQFKFRHSPFRCRSIASLDSLTIRPSLTRKTRLMVSQTWTTAYCQ